MEGRKGREGGEGGEGGRAGGMTEGREGGMKVGRRKEEGRERGARAKLGFPPSNVFNDNVQSIR